MKDTLLDFMPHCSERALEAFRKLDGYHAYTHSDHGYTLLTPTTPTLTPVLIHVNLNSPYNRVPFATIHGENIDYKIDGYPKEKDFSVDSLGGCAAVYKVATNFTAKPLILLLHDGTYDNALSFVKSGRMGSIRPLLNHVVSVDCIDAYIAYHSGKDITPPMWELLMYELDYTDVRKSSNLSLGYLLEEYYDIPHISVGYGGSESRPNRLDPAYISQGVNMLGKLICSLDDMHSKCYDDTSYMDFSKICEVCGDRNRLGVFDREHEAILCPHCRTRIEQRSKSKSKLVGDALVTYEKRELLLERIRSRKQNLYHKLNTVDESINIDHCPMCNSPVLVASRSRGCITCVSCKELYLDKMADEGVIPPDFNGDIVERYSESDKKYLYSIVFNDYVYTLDYNTESNQFSNPEQGDILVTDNKTFGYCSICGEVQPIKVLSKRQVIGAGRKTIETQVCVTCLKTI